MEKIEKPAKNLFLKFLFFLAKIFGPILIFQLLASGAFAENKIPDSCRKIMNQKNLTAAEIAAVENFWEENDCSAEFCSCVDTKKITEYPKNLKMFLLGYKKRKFIIPALFIFDAKKK